jgi:NAD(P)-dependent dehydrogenase (short-subunit alcohol dehydrogenase family)
MEDVMRAYKTCVVLITGCSSGLGRALAEEFFRQGHTVFATARCVEDIQDLATLGVITLSLDVTNSSSISAAIHTIVNHTGRIDLLINNAGYGLMGPVVEIPLPEVRLQFETNVIGPLALVQAVFPYMLKQGEGRIVNVGSVSGILTTPFAGLYCASKAALHSLSEALRLEMAPFGIKVITLQPAKIASKFGDSAANILRKLFPQDSVYSPIFQFIEMRARASQSDATSAAKFARSIVRAVTRKKPPHLLRLGRESLKMPIYKWAVPRKLMDGILCKMFGLHLLRIQLMDKRIE